MPATVVLGTQWGDEGKGKAVDYLADRMDVVVRYQGGNNAGHTIIAEGRLLKLHLVPSGILYPHVTSVIADGVVVDPEVLLAEMDDLAAAGVEVTPAGYIPGNRHCQTNVPHICSAGDISGRLPANFKNPFDGSVGAATESPSWRILGRTRSPKGKWPVSKYQRVAPNE